jgi:hypothetical protein
MKTIRILLQGIISLFLVFLGVLMGNYVGDRLRALITDDPGHQLEFIRQDEHGNTFIAANMLLSNLLPGLLVATFFRPRILFAFLAGMVASFFLGDRYEDQLWDGMDELLSGGDPTRNWPDPIKQVEVGPPRR